MVPGGSLARPGQAWGLRNMMIETCRPRDILLVDDDSVEAMIVQRVLRDLAISSELVHVTDGDRALTHMRNEEAELPFVILLDLNMPRMTGLEFLEIIKADSKLKDIPVVVVTTSQYQEDMTMSFALGAVAYIVKSPSYPEFRERIKAFRRLLDPHASENLLQTVETPASNDSP
jgi:CheY-like chemotaxis protein